MAQYTIRKREREREVNIDGGGGGFQFGSQRRRRREIQRHKTPLKSRQMGAWRMAGWVSFPSHLFATQTQTPSLPIPFRAGCSICRLGRDQVNQTIVWLIHTVRFQCFNRHGPDLLNLMSFQLVGTEPKTITRSPLAKGKSSLSSLISPFPSSPTDG